MKETVAVLVPVRWSVPADFWINFMKILGQMGQVCLPRLYTNSHTPLYEARNRLVEDALRSKSDWTLWLDSDVIPPPNVYELLRFHNKDIVTGLYFAVTPPYQPIAHMWYGDKSEFIRSQDLKIGETFPIYSAGMGCALIKTEVFKRMETPWFDHKPNVVSEDVYFYQKAKDLGYQSYLDTNVLADHWGGSINVGMYVAYQNYLSRMEEFEKNGNKR